MTTERPKRLTAKRLSRSIRAALYSDDADAVIRVALQVLELRLKSTKNVLLQSPMHVRDYLRLHLAEKQEERFCCVWLDAQHRVIELQEAFRGSLSQTSVYPREIVKDALACNAAAVIFAHNHPSGVCQPSHADELLTKNLKEALDLVEVKVLDHMIVAGNQIMSFAERGLL